MAGFRCTYRLQLTPELNFRRVREVVLPYARELGVSHLYLSPVLQARHESTHGYDVVDPTRVSDELGGEEELRSLCEATRGAGLGTILDVVPNHMATSEDENPFWRDLETRAKFFDWDRETGWYRRFFDIGELAGVRVEDPEVFEATHAKVLELVRAGLVAGLRIDHPDGLANPREYLDRLRESGVERIWVEKILEPGERLRPDWPVEGTTGYEFANDVTALFVDAAGEEPLTSLYVELTGERRSFAEVAHEAKLEVARTTFAQEFGRLRALCPYDGLEEAAAALHVYRTYVERDRIAEDDREACAVLPEDLRRIILGFENPEFVVRWQQTTGPVMAKGVEDTAFYRWFRLTALNEVGGNPDRFSLSPDEFHDAAIERLERHPHALLASQTHDTKRAGDVRARIGALAAARRVGRARSPLARAHGRDGRSERGIPRLADAGRRLADRPGTPRALSREGAARGEANDELDRTERAARATCSRVRAEPLLEPRVPRRLRAVRNAHRKGRGTRVARGAPAPFDEPRCARPLPGRRALVAQPRRPGQPAARRLAGAHLRAAGAGADAGDHEGPPDPAVLRLRAEWPEAFAGGYEPLDLGPDRIGFVRGGAIRVVVPLRAGDRAAGGDCDLLPEYDQELSVVS